MKKLLLTLVFASFSLATNYTGKVIGRIDVHDGYNSSFEKIYCINGVQYMGRLDLYNSSNLTPLFNSNGHIKTCY